ncbi:hypothetical protein Poli38472_009472 [Pythium oligandrum]|uniref:Uncharacterized protein n=1 Tax=Pythium oligandrum TaxID=41045 RepID=A0A8K1FIE0_PYTOL|nr:hypothetical protein Poli38472_009472 [Pythium oligandrum]|eukprot:TMW61979.1 hypothetical protein Poli38472_009472 [Pythium oligandrum]
MDLLSVESLADADVVASQTQTHDAHGFLVSASALDSAAALRDSGDESIALTGAEDDEVDGSTAPTTSFQAIRPVRAKKRRKIGKALQLALLRKYVNCVKELRRIPDRLTTEQLLEEAYDEFYFHGGNLNEPRLAYASFLKLVRNRRGEVLKRQRELETGTSDQSGRKTSKEQAEIIALVAELERIRRSDPTDGNGNCNCNSNSNATGNGNLASFEMMETEGHELARASLHENEPAIASSDAALADFLTTASRVPAPPTASVMVHGEEHVLISKPKLELVLRFTQETLHSHKKLLEQVCALERQLAELQHHHHDDLDHHHPLGH